MSTMVMQVSTPGRPEANTGVGGTKVFLVGTQVFRVRTPGRPKAKTGVRSTKAFE